MQVTSKVYQAAIQSVAGPLQRFADTGLYSGDEDRTLGEPAKAAGVVSHQQIGRIVRNFAKETKRPFIKTFELWKTHEWAQDTVTGDYGRRPITPFLGEVCIKIPNLKYLAPIYAPLLLAAGDQLGKTCGGNRAFPAWGSIGPNVMHFRIYSLEFWLEYENALDQDDMRAIRRAPAKGETCEIR